MLLGLKTVYDTYVLDNWVYAHIYLPSLCDYKQVLPVPYNYMLLFGIIANNMMEMSVSHCIVFIR